MKKLPALDDVVSIVIFLGLIGTVTLQVISRYIGGSTIPWTEEFARFQLIAVTYIGASIAVRNRTHMALNVVHNLVPQTVAQVMNGTARTLEGVFYGWITVVAVQMAQFSGTRPMVTFPVPRAALFYLVAFGFALMTFRVLQDIVQEVRSRNNFRARPVDLPEGL